MIVLSLCDRSGVAVEPWARDGYRCVCVDIAAEPRTRRVSGGGRIEHVRADVAEWEGDGSPVRFAFAFPPCTDLASSGARHFASKGLPRLISALSLVERCRMLLEATGAPWCIENPIGRLSTCWRRPDYLFNPCDFGAYLSPPGDAYTKRTCLWVGGGFRMPTPRPVEPIEGSKMHRMPETKDRAAKRSLTPAGWAEAVWRANR